MRMYEPPGYNHGALEAQPAPEGAPMPLTKVGLVCGWVNAWNR